ncbi:hypothetical protein BC829DRAFT_442071 [Chytridium lagenaria]|nr:hypothetical protein BC829DRAFT_442071 [Chytridium lagenaria]
MDCFDGIGWDPLEPVSAHDVFQQALPRLHHLRIITVEADSRSAEYLPVFGSTSNVAVSRLLLQARNPTGFWWCDSITRVLMELHRNRRQRDIHRLDLIIPRSYHNGIETMPHVYDKEIRNFAEDLMNLVLLRGKLHLSIPAHGIFAKTLFTQMHALLTERTGDRKWLGEPIIASLSLFVQIDALKTCCWWDGVKPLAEFVCNISTKLVQENNVAFETWNHRSLCCCPACSPCSITGETEEGIIWVDKRMLRTFNSKMETREVQFESCARTPRLFSDRIAIAAHWLLPILPDMMEKELEKAELLFSTWMDALDKALGNKDRMVVGAWKGLKEENKKCR